MSDFHQNGNITTLHNLRTRSLDDLEYELQAFGESRRITLVLPWFLTLQDAEAKADEFSVAAAEVSNLTIAAEPAGLTIDVAVTVAVAFPDDMAFKVLLAERVAVITYVDDLVQLPIGSLTIGAVELTPGEVTPLTTAFHLHLRQDTFWGAGPASPVFSGGGGSLGRPTARRASGPSAPTQASSSRRRCSRRRRASASGRRASTWRRARSRVECNHWFGWS